MIFQNQNAPEELPLVPVYPAIVWCCPSCETENVARTVLVELTEEEREKYGLKSTSERGYLNLPVEVECGHCGEHFETDSSFGGVDHMGDANE
jgi:hypothetical protein